MKQNTEIQTGTELKDTQNGNVIVVTETTVGDCGVQVWSESGRLQREQRMCQEHLSDAVNDGELRRL